MVAGLLLASCIALPGLLALLLLVRPLRSPVMRLAPWAAAPLPFAAFNGGTLNLDWAVLGMTLGVDDTSSALLLLAGSVWLAAGWHAAGHFKGDESAPRYWAFHLLTLAANAGVLLAQDLLGLYIWYALTTLCVYGLVVHDRRPASLRAGRVYVVMAIVAEGLLIGAVLLVGALTGNAPLYALPTAVADHAHGTLLTVLLLLGFAVKMGTVPLHLWLPLAHPCAPVPASAVLSGVIVKAGLVGWMRLLPLGEAGFSWAATPVLVLGLVSALLAAAVGLTQVRAKALLAYSTISQMGLITVLLGVVLAVPAAWPTLLPVLLLFALHHGLAKGALFLGVSVAPLWCRRLLWLPAASLAGLPLTSGLLAKAAAKQAADLAPGIWGQLLPHALVLSSVLTTLLMLRLMSLLAAATPPPQPPQRWQPAAVLALVLAGIALPWLWGAAHVPATVGYAFGIGAMFDAGWPIAVAVAVAVLWHRSGRTLPAVPEGDLVIPLERAIARLRATGQRLASGHGPQWRRRGWLPVRALVALDRSRLRLSAAGALLLLGALALAWAALA